ncbi:MAG: cation:proton antiporter [Vicinamibacterales bacterium]
MPSWLTPDIGLVVLFFLLFVFPRFLQRLGLPSALTALAIGIAAGHTTSVFAGEPTIGLLSTLGIVALFLFAGLDVDPAELREQARAITEHVLVRLTLVLATAWAARLIFGLEPRAAMLVALALLTPSTGFILDSLGGWGLSSTERFWVRSKAIATELVALAILFAAVQSTSLERLAGSAVALLLMMVVLPVVFRWFAAAIVPHAPKSEFGLLMTVAAACALITRALGVYYLVGAFVVGMAARRFRRALPSMASDQMLGSVEAFASLFVPFYFFHAGATLPTTTFATESLITGAAFAAIVLPIRLLTVVGHRRLRFGEAFKDGLRISVPMLPTTVFTIVIVEILRTSFEVPAHVRGGLIVYAIVTTLAPSIWMRRAVPSFEAELEIRAEERAKIEARSRAEAREALDAREHSS